MGLHKNYVKKQLQNPRYREIYEIEKEIARITVEIQKLRMQQGISQSELAKKAHLTQQQVSAIEHGSNITLKTLLQIGHVLGLKLSIQQ